MKLLRPDGRSERKRRLEACRMQGRAGLHSLHGQGSTYGVIFARPASVVPNRAATKVPRPGQLVVVRVSRLPGDRALGRLIAGPTVLCCALGPAGITRDKREGDGKTPAGRFRLCGVLVRSDRIGRPRTALPLRRLSPADGWCDDPSNPRYNRRVCRPFAPSHEAMWREDSLYDCVVVIDYNLPRVRKGRGSAIFLHVAEPRLTPTAGCVAIPRSALLRLLPRLGPGSRVVIA